MNTTVGSSDFELKHSVVDSEFGFELQVCQWAERHWPPNEADTDGPIIVARQLGTQHRRWDTVVIECDPDALAQRATFGSDRLDSDILHVVRNAPPEFTWYREALPDPGYPWRYVRDAVHRAADRGIIETDRKGNRIHLRRKWAYPDWVNRIIAIENKPDLGASAASALSNQLEYDVALGLADAVWVATQSTDERVEPIFFADLPTKVGTFTVDVNSDGLLNVEAHLLARRLNVCEPGIRITDRSSRSTNSGPAVSFEYVDPKWKQTKRLEIAERAYERGWRSYVDSMRPDCQYFTVEFADGVHRPFCTAKDRHQTAAECSGECGQFEPEPPNWRQYGWPIQGGPGVGIKQILAARRRRHRPGLQN